jgi:hypothetical protein
MRALILTTAFLVAAFSLLFTGTARASTFDFHVPFPFVVHGRTLPAGQYQVDDTGNVIEIRGSRTGVFVLSTPASGYDPNGSWPVLTFTRDENQYRLDTFWESSSEGDEVRSR